MSIAEKLTTIAENEQKVYDAGYKKGGIDAYWGGYQNGYDFGSYDRWMSFWDNFQNNGNRVYYACAFCGAGWTTETFRPKYNITPVGIADNMFYTFGKDVGTLDRPLMDLAQQLEELGVWLDCSQMTRAYRSFYNARFSRLPELDFSNCPYITNAFTYSPIETIDKLILGNVTFTDKDHTTVFNQCNNLKNITIEGVFPLSVSFPNSPLSTKSIVNIVEHLSPNAQGQTLTLLRTAVNNMVFPFTSEESGRTYNSFEELVGSTSWSISLV